MIFAAAVTFCLNLIFLFLLLFLLLKCCRALIGDKGFFLHLHVVIVKLGSAAAVRKRY